EAGLCSRRRACRSLLSRVPDTTPTEIYSLSLHDALPIFVGVEADPVQRRVEIEIARRAAARPAALRVLGERPQGEVAVGRGQLRSEEHTSELQSREKLVCRLLLEKKKRHSPTSQASPPRS